MKILFIVPYPLKRSPSQRFRFEQYFDDLKSAGHTVHVQSFLTDNGWKVIYSKGFAFLKAMAILQGFIRRIFTIPAAMICDIVFLHREATPVGPPFFEFVIAKILGKKIIYDFDDAIWLTDRQDEGWLGKTMRWRSKVASIIRWSQKVSCGNDYLLSFAKQFNASAFLIPTTIDTNYHHPLPQSKKENEIVIGWTGSHSTLKYLDEIVPAIQVLEKEYPQLVFLVIANKKPDLAVSSLRFVEWNEQTEIEDLAKIDIGVMPLPDDEWSKGKCGFKLLQYMALEKPSVAAPVGVNVKIITDHVDGLISRNTEEWIASLKKLILDPALREKLGKAGRKKVEDNYSVNSNRSSFLSLFSQSAINTRATR